MTRTAILALASLFVSAPAFAWSVPLTQSGVTAEPGPHNAGDPIPCTVDNGWGQTFSGTVTTVNGELHCTGMAAPDDEDDIATAVREYLGEVTVDFDDEGGAELFDNRQIDDLLTSIGGRTRF